MPRWPGIYLGQPAFKAMGARSSYMFLNGVLIPIVAFANLTAIVFQVRALCRFARAGDEEEGAGAGQESKGG